MAKVSYLIIDVEDKRADRVTSDQNKTLEEVLVDYLTTNDINPSYGKDGKSEFFIVNEADCGHFFCKQGIEVEKANKKVKNNERIEGNR